MPGTCQGAVAAGQGNRGGREELRPPGSRRRWIFYRTKPAKPAKPGRSLVDGVRDNRFDGSSGTRDRRHRTGFSDPFPQRLNCFRHDIWVMAKGVHHYLSDVHCLGQIRLWRPDETRGPWLAERETKTSHCGLHSFAGRPWYDNTRAPQLGQFMVSAISIFLICTPIQFARLHCLKTVGQS